MVNKLFHVYNIQDTKFSKNGDGRPNPRPYVVVSQKGTRLVVAKLHSMNPYRLSDEEYNDRVKKINDGKWFIVEDTKGHRHAAAVALIDSYHQPIRTIDPELYEQPYTIKKGSMFRFLRHMFDENTIGYKRNYSTVHEFHYRKKK